MALEAQYSRAGSPLAVTGHLPPSQPGCGNTDVRANGKNHRLWCMSSELFLAGDKRVDLAWSLKAIVPGAGRVFPIGAKSPDFTAGGSYA